MPNYYCSIQPKNKVWNCAICKEIVPVDPKTANTQFPIPKSHYWNEELNEVYCSAEHSMVRVKQLI